MGLGKMQDDTTGVVVMPTHLSIEMVQDILSYIYSLVRDAQVLNLFGKQKLMYQFLNFHAKHISYLPTVPI